jgi:hypothetical protein
MKNKNDINRYWDHVDTHCRLIWKFIFDKKRETPFVKLLTSFGDKDFEKISDPQECDKIIKNWNPT